MTDIGRLQQRLPRGPNYELVSGALRRRTWSFKIVAFTIVCAFLALLLFSTSLGAHMDVPYLSPALEGFSMKGAYVRPHTGEYVAPHEDEWTWERVQGMVNQTRGFYARDWPLQLGWNNVRIKAVPAPFTFASPFALYLYADKLYPRYVISSKLDYSTLRY